MVKQHLFFYVLFCGYILSMKLSFYKSFTFNLCRLPTPPKGRVYEEMGKHHFPFRFPGDESLSMFSSPLAKSRRKSLPSFPIASVGHQGTNVRMQSFRVSCLHCFMFVMSYKVVLVVYQVIIRNYIKRELDGHINHVMKTIVFHLQM